MSYHAAGRYSVLQHVHVATAGAVMVTLSGFLGLSYLYGLWACTTACGMFCEVCKCIACSDYAVSSCLSCDLAFGAWRTRLKLELAGWQLVLPMHQMQGIS